MKTNVGSPKGRSVLWRRRPRSSRESNASPGRTGKPSTGPRGPGDRTLKLRKVCEMQNAETVLGVLRGSLESPVPRNGHAGFGGRPHGKGPAERQAPRRAVDPTFSMHRWRTAAGTGAHLIWRVKNGAKSLPAKVITTLADGSHLVRLRESDATLSARRKASQDKTIPRLDDITVTAADQGGRSRTSQFRVLTTLLDHDSYPAAQVACYAQRWQVELVY